MYIYIYIIEGGDTITASLLVCSVFVVIEEIK